MKRTDLKRLMKPLIRECIHEVLVDEGILAKVVTEVAKGMGNVIVENRPVTASTQPTANINQEAIDAQKKHLDQQRQQLTEAIGDPALNHVFEGVSPMAAPAEPGPNPMQGVSPTDAGVDISSIMGMGGHRWKALASRKNK
tara:strand:- start:2317 stop:2739 length:423 start_codon:yes stop_codon:yes gene_type:complete